MFKCQTCRASVVDDDTANVGSFCDVGNSNNRDRQVPPKWSVDEDHSFHPPVQECVGRLLDQLWRSSMTDHKVEVTLLREALLNAANYGRRKLVPDIRKEECDTISTLDVQVTREDVWPIIELPHCLPDSFLRLLRNSSGQRGVADHH